jgi:hypothetical protein
VAAFFNLFRTAQQAQEAGERALTKLVAKRDAETAADVGVRGDHGFWKKSRRRLHAEPTRSGPRVALEV